MLDVHVMFDFKSNERPDLHCLICKRHKFRYDFLFLNKNNADVYKQSFIFVREFLAPRLLALHCIREKVPTNYINQ